MSIVTFRGVSGLGGIIDREGLERAGKVLAQLGRRFVVRRSLYASGLLAFAARLSLKYCQSSQIRAYLFR